MYGRIMMPKTVVHIKLESESEAELQDDIERIWDFLADDTLVDEWIEEPCQE
jgi:hypothetical protein